MNQTIVYTLVNYPNIGCLPECVVVDTNEKGEFSVNFTKITQSNKSNITYLLDDTDRQLLDYCLRLDKEVIAAKINDRKAKDWNDISKKFFENRKIKQEDIFLRDYLLDYIETNQNAFFSNLGDKPLFLPQGRFPFTWIPLFIEDEMPELLYCFENTPDWIYFYPDIRCKQKPLSLLNGMLVSRKNARILLKNKIYEFDDKVDGSKFSAFFSKDKISVSQINAEEYIQKVIVPLIATNRVVPLGFEIQTISLLQNAVLRIKELEPIRQVTLFDDETTDNSQKSLVLELIFEYQGFRFWAGQPGKSTSVEMSDNSFSILKVERDKVLEQLYIDAMKDAGIDLDGKVRKFAYSEGLDWLNEHYKQLELTGVDVKFESRRGEPHKVFVGERSVFIEVEEGRDWFDIKGKVKFGKYEIPFVRVLNYIRQNKHEMMLPNGEYVQIPLVWFEEYKALIEFSRIEDGKVVIAKYHCVVAEDLKQKLNINFSIKENMRRLLSSELNHNFDLPENFRGELRHYQREGYNWLRMLDELSLGGCLADDMGLGKTIQTLCMLLWQKQQKMGVNLLVVPTSLIYNWEEEACKFTPDLRIYVHSGNQRSKDSKAFHEADIVLTSYGVLRRDKQLLSSFPFNYIILDEAQAIKNPQSDTSQVCLGLHGRRFLTLTGTPIENSLTDLWSQVHFFNRNMLGSSSHFLRACKTEGKQELYRHLLKPFMLRRNKKDVLTELPEKQITVQWCDMTDAQLKIYRDFRNNYREKFLGSKDEKDRVNTMILLEGLLRLRQIANHPSLVENGYNDDSGKFETVCEMMTEVIDQGDKVLIFSSFVEHLKLYRKFLDAQNIKYAYLDGATKDRKEQVDKFQNNDDIQVFLLSLKAGGTGLNLTKASYVFLLDPWWNPAAEAQAYDRAHRIGQQNKVFVYKFISRNSIEEKILRLQEEKLKLSESMLGSDNELLKQLDINEVMKLIE
ncbi:MAG: DEAD/DEAH box helicase [Paludibacteraceae bacterium]|nr:DEAD/DEAH box helicase [Paludibacteraceae bacterium]